MILSCFTTICHRCVQEQQLSSVRPMVLLFAFEVMRLRASVMLLFDSRVLITSKSLPTSIGVKILLGLISFVITAVVASDMRYHMLFVAA